MSDIKFACQRCGHHLIVDSKGAGLDVPCPRCHKHIAVPHVASKILARTAPPQNPYLPETPEKTILRQAAKIPPGWVVALSVIGLVLSIFGFKAFLAAITAVICAHVAKAQTSRTSASSARGLAQVGLVLGYTALCLNFYSWQRHNLPATLDSSKPVIKEASIQGDLQAFYNSSQGDQFMPQKVFDSIHPVGTANRIEVHDVSITWKNGQPSSEEEDILALTIRLTVFWNSPLISDGFTKLKLVYDNEVGRESGLEILATNGRTNEDIAKGFLTLMATALFAGEE